MPTLQFYVKESYPDNSDTRDAKTLDGTLYTPFTGEMNSVAHAERFLAAHGNFWHNRNQKLVLFRDGQAIAFADKTKLKIRHL